MSAEKNRAIALLFIKTMNEHGGVNESLVTEDFHIWGSTMGTLDMRTYKNRMSEAADPDGARTIGFSKPVDP